MPPAIEFRAVSLSAGGRTILDRVSLSLHPGTTTAILGRSGSGKTTLLRMVNRLIQPTSGAVFVNGQDISKQLAQAELIRLRRGIGYVIQEAGLFPHLTVARNVMMVPELEGRDRASFSGRVKELLTMVGLDPAQFAERYPARLSGGQRQRVGLARALAAEPALLLMDEPFGALDPLTRAEMQEMLLALLARLREQNKQKTVLLVTHDLDEALFLATRVVLVEAGRVVADLPPHEFLHSPDPAVTAYVKAFHRGEKARA